MGTRQDKAHEGLKMKLGGDWGCPVCSGTQSF